jgi:hypothetical protein
LSKEFWLVDMPALMLPWLVWDPWMNYAAKL